jgi:DNA-binding MarR family transcriptional regulator/N-acetylglutamate synthase-like GNAT family acetyltransferase
MTTAAAERLRAFNRFYTGTIGALEQGYLRSPFTLTEARVLFELGRGGELEVVDLRRRTGLDAGYLSRILASFADQGLVDRRRSETDARRQLVVLTGAGRAAYGRLDRASAGEATALLDRLGQGEADELLASLDSVERLLGEDPVPEVRLRDLEPGDLGWAIGANGRVYAAEHGWDATFEGLVAEILGEFAREHDPACERGWIAEAGGRRAGCIFCVRADGETAKLRVLLVEPWARGHGVGRALVDACLAFARDAGYRRIVLWTNDVLADARRLYERAGFELVEEGPHRAFGRDLVEQTWSRELSQSPTEQSARRPRTTPCAH